MLAHDFFRPSSFDLGFSTIWGSLSSVIYGALFVFAFVSDPQFSSMEIQGKTMEIQAKKVAQITFLAPELAQTSACKARSSPK